MAEVAEELQVVLDAGVAPDLGGVGHVGVAGGGEGGRVEALHAAVGRVGVAVLEAEVGEPGLAEGQADVAGEAVGVAVAGPVGAGVELEAAPGRVVLEQEVDDAGDGVRAVLRRRAVAQHLDLPEGDGRNGRDVGPLRPVGHPAEPRDDRRAVAPLAVHEDEGVVVREVAQARRPHEGRGVADGVGGDVERGDQVAELVVEGRGPLAHHVLEGDGVDGHLRLGDRARLAAAAEDDDPLGELDGQLNVEGDRGPGSDCHGLPHDPLEAGQREHHLERAGRQRRDRERAGAVGDGGSDQYASFVPGANRDPGENETRRVRDGARQYRILRGSDSGRDQGQQNDQGSHESSRQR